METRAKLRFPRTLLSSLKSCKTQHLLSDVIHHHHQQQNHHQKPVFSALDPQIPFSSASIERLLPPTSPAPKPPTSYPSMCKPRCPETFDEMVRENCILSRERRKVCDHSSAFFYDDVVGPGGCPPVSPSSPLTEYFKLEKQEKLKNNTTKKKKKKQQQKQRKKENPRRTRVTQFGKEKMEPFSSKCSSSYEDWFSSDDEREEDDETETETETLFSSSRSFLSLSSKSFSFSSDPDSTGRTQVRNRRKPPSSRRMEVRKKRSSEVGVIPLEEKVKRSFAVVKSSSDPYNDFRTSMVEMIMEKQIFGAKELEQLLQCFLSLNAAHHHRIIVEVFTEIWEALFANLIC